MTVPRFDRHRGGSGRPLCTELTLVGEPCRNPASVNQRWCWRHAPPALEVVGGPWDGDPLRAWCPVLYVAFTSTAAQRWCGWADPARAIEAGDVRGVYRRDNASRIWRWERASASRSADAEREEHCG